MPIDIYTEQVESLSQAARRLPSSRAGKRVHASTLQRWANHGLKGVCLETIRIGGTKCTSREALQRFFDQLASNRQCYTTVSAEKTKSTERYQTDIERRLEAIGL